MRAAAPNNTGVRNYLLVKGPLSPRRSSFLGSSRPSCTSPCPPADPPPADTAFSPPVPGCSLGCVFWVSWDPLPLRSAGADQRLSPRCKKKDRLLLRIGGRGRCPLGFRELGMRYNRRALSSRMSGGFLGVAARVMALGVVVSLLLLFAGMGALVVIHVCVVGRVFRRGRVAIAREQACAGLPPEDLEVLPCYEHSKLSADNTDGTGGSICAVCQEGFLAGDRCRLLPLCRHSFHAQCVDSWLLRSSVCPICRTTADVRKGQAAPAGGRETSEAQ